MVETKVRVEFPIWVCVRHHRKNMCEVVGWSINWVNESSELESLEDFPLGILQTFWSGDVHKEWNWRSKFFLKRFQKAGRSRQYQVNSSISNHNNSNYHLLFVCSCQVFCVVFDINYKIKYHPYLSPYLLSFPYIYCILFIYLIALIPVCIYMLTCWHMFYSALSLGSKFHKGRHHACFIVHC